MCALLGMPFLAGSVSGQRTEGRGPWDPFEAGGLRRVHPPFQPFCNPILRGSHPLHETVYILSHRQIDSPHENEESPFFSPARMGGDEMCFFQEAYESNCIAPMGPQVDAFEREFCEKVGSPMPRRHPWRISCLLRSRLFFPGEME